MKYELKQIFCRPWTLSQFSLQLIESHYENNYGGAMRRLNSITAQLEALDWANAPAHVINGLKREELVALNSTLLHELYFASMGGDGRVTPKMSERLSTSSASKSPSTMRESLCWYLAATVVSSTVTGLS